MIKLFLLSITFVIYSYSQELPILVNEEFSSSENAFLKEVTADTYNAKILNGIYKINFSSDKYWFNFMTSKYIKPSDNFVIETKIKYIGGKNGYGFGLVFGNINYENSNYFLVTGNGFYKIMSSKKGVDNEYDGWVESSLVKVDSYNVIRIEKTDDLYKFFINGTLVETLDNIEIYGFNQGISVQNMINVDVEYFKIWANETPINLAKTDKMRVLKEPLSDNVNTEGMEKSPVISPDGNTLFFNREVVSSSGNKNDDIYYSEKDNNGEWMPSKSIGSPLNNDGHNGIVSVTTDNNTMIIMNTYNEDGTQKGSGLSITNKVNDKWEVPKDISIKDFYNRANFNEYMISADGQILVVALERDDTYGQKDVYVCFKEDETTFSAPKNLGSVVNTIGNEVGPFLAPDLKTLYYSSDGLPGYGTNDMYMTRRLDDTWTNWSEPVNLGPSINSTEWDAYLTLDASGEFAYMNTSTPDRDLEIIKIGLPLSLRPEALCLVKGRVYDSKTNETLDGIVSYKDIKTNEQLGTANSDDITGIYQIILTRGRKYSFNASKDGYYPISQNIDLTNINEYKEIIVDLPLTLIEKNAEILLNNLFFDYNKANLQSESFPELNQLIEFLSSNPDKKIDIIGHTDDKGSPQYNKKLSQDRANSVMQYLITQGIDSKRLTAKGMGEQIPKLPNTTDENREKNRRVEVKIK